MTSSRLSNPLALAVLTLLYERPMHPYEMSTTLRERHKGDSIKLNFGSLYSVVGSLQRAGLVDVQEVVREGNRPERTVYAITEPGKDRMISWLSELVSVPTKEYPQFEAALSLIGILPPDDAIRLLEHRLDALTLQRASSAGVDAVLPPDFPRLFLVESEYARALLDAEIQFVGELITDLRDDPRGEMRVWRRMHELRGTDLSPEERDAALAAEFPAMFRWRKEAPPQPST